MKSIVVLSSIIIGSGLLAINSHKPEHLPISNHFKRADAPAGPVGGISIVIDKSDYELSVYDQKGWYATYPVVFGNNSLEDKKMEGDNNTPEGSFKIVNKKPHQKWNLFMALDYPTKDSWDKFRQRKEGGQIPKNATIGGGVGIHGVWPHEDFVVDRFKNWTMGCISMKNGDISEVYAFTTLGTTVTIKK